MIQTSLILVLLFVAVKVGLSIDLIAFISLITVHPRREKAKNDAESLEQMAPKHPSSFFAVDEGDELG